MSHPRPPTPESIAQVSRRVLAGNRLSDGTLAHGVINAAYYEAVVYICEHLTLKSHCRAIASMGGLATRNNHTADWRRENAYKAAKARWAKARELAAES